MKDIVRIGSSSNRMLTKKELIDVINNNFTDEDYYNIAVVTTLNSDINDERVQSQTVTFSKVLSL